MSVIWTPEAQQDRLEIWEYIATESPYAAARLDELFSAAANRLTTHPEMGRPGTVPGTRELIPHENYRLVYEINSEVIWILALVHTARLWPFDA
ncbi:type II toxin-antitoxin system RelE/ParE family toxin [Pseudomonas gingeri]|uniref:Type II toxin-antitoxin system RelE/ParE family toxin n=1 Tax=Pseudomonas gingeri TaxID=117681 RepID=A0A7Y7XFP6_9PSED|nr:type II toxin-antitoxin system RelE/ParE family toxin [Pseudomonas gingeri]NWB98829.1 type II toxin-antitoxin system RelE/ParE family toxin [Pseudomonas gingeri]